MKDRPTHSGGAPKRARTERGCTATGCRPLCDYDMVGHGMVCYVRYDKMCHERSNYVITT